MPNWLDHLARYNVGGVILFGKQFLERWGDQPWPAHEDAKFADDVSAAAKLHIQLVSRITTQRLPYADGVEAAALKSVYQLFGEARDIFKAHPKSQLTEAISWEVLNEHVRPFTAKWHRQSERGALAAVDVTDIFRNELSALQRKLIIFDTLLVEIRDGAAPKPPVGEQETEREKRIAEEMAGSLPWEIDEKLGGIEKKEDAIAIKINTAERIAVQARRSYYYARNTQRAAQQASPPPHYQEAWKSRTHASALAISGGGIRSATFALGVLVALARRNLLFQFDYLSTVSGGGYVGSFLTTFLNSAAAPAAPSDQPDIGLLRDDWPFRRQEGEADALRHVRHHSKYLATGRLWERLQMTFAQVYGMAMNGLGFAYLAVVAALVEYGLRVVLPENPFWSKAAAAIAIALVLTGLFIPLIMRLTSAIERWADAVLATLFVGLIGILVWQFFGDLHRLADECGFGLIVIAVVPLVASALLALVGNIPGPIRTALLILSILAAPLLFLGIEMAVYGVMEQIFELPLIGGFAYGWEIALAGAVVASLLFWFCFDINFTAPHRHYKKKLGEAYLLQRNPEDPDGRLLQNVRLRLSEAAEKARGPYHLVNCALNVPASDDPAMQGRLTEFFLFSPAFCGSPLTGYQPTERWQDLDPALDLGTAMAISGAAAAPQMGTGTIRNFSFWLALLNVRLSYWIRNANKAGSRGSPPGLSYLLWEMFGWATEKGRYINVSDGGHIENLGIYELLRRRCKYIVAIDGEQDAQMTFHGLTTLQRLAFIDLGVTIDIGVDALRLGDKGLSHSHFAFCRIRYPTDSREGDPSFGYLIYLKLSLTGNEGEFIRRYRLDEPAFPHHSTADQFFTEAQFEAYRSLGEHVGDKMFLPAIVGDDVAKSKDVNLEQWFGEIGKSMLEPLEKTESGRGLALAP